MASFNSAYQAVIKRFEGGYSDRAADRGGETIYGISRVKHPRFKIWARVDELKAAAKGSPEISLNNDSALLAMARGFYKARWDRFHGDDIPDQTMANKLFDMQTLLGHGGMTRRVQRILNVFNKRGTIYPDIKVDGGFGPNTLRALKSNLREFGHRNMVTGSNVLQAYKLIQLAEKDESQEDNMNGWFNRVRLSEA